MNRPRKLLLIGGLAYLAVLHVIAVLAFFAPHVLPYQGWRLGLPSAEPTSYVTERHRYIQWLDKHAEPGALALLGASHLELVDASLLGDHVLKYAAGGDTLRHTAERVGDYPNLAQARAIVLWVGFNDIAYRDADEIAADFPVLLSRLPVNVPVFALGLGPSSAAEKQPAIAAINARYQQFCAQQPRCTFLDTVPLLAAPDGNLNPAYDRGDGIHLNRNGYRKLAEALRPLLPPVITKGGSGAL